MEDRLKKHIDGLFENAPWTKKTVELKEEMLQNLTEKYFDLTNEGKSEDAAYNIVVAGIGDITELIIDLEENEMRDPEVYEKARQKSALLTAVAVMIYILSPIPGIITSSFGFDNIGGILFLIMVAAATGLIVYNNMTKPKYVRTQDTMVEDFKEWQSDRNDKRSLRRSISAALWSVICALYFIISFTTMAWHITWVIFIIGGAVEAFISIFFISKR